MKIRTPALCLMAMVVSASALAGDLNPPVGPVSETGRFGPRVEINFVNTPGDANSLFQITQPGSYYLASNLTGVVNKHGIKIASSGVTLDLMGFELIGFTNPDGTLTSLDGISVIVDAVPEVNVHIRNGSVRNWGGDGVDAANANNSSLSDLLAQGNGVDGLRIGAGSLVSGNTAQSNGGRGISAGFGSMISRNTVSSNLGLGIIASSGCTVSRNTAFSNGFVGINAAVGCTVNGNTAFSNSGDGIAANTACTVSGNTASFNSGDGIEVLLDCLVLNNTCVGNGNFGDGAGIHVTGGDNRIDSNFVTDNDRGLDVDVGGNLIIRNSASGNSFNYSAVVGGNAVGPFITTTSTITSNNPWANFNY